MGKYVILNDDNFEQEVIKSDIPVLIDFWAEWCMPCKMIAPIVEELAEEFDGKLKVGKLDVDSNPKVSMQFGIRSIPTLLLFKSGQPVDQIIGAVPKKAILQKILPHIES
ncbi:MAG: thioredoxin [Calditrichaeota bacterium]|nr:thioredoxin [Calditrichota bacterium]